MIQYLYNIRSASTCVFRRLPCPLGRSVRPVDAVGGAVTARRVALLVRTIRVGGLDLHRAAVVLVAHVGRPFALVGFGVADAARSIRLVVEAADGLRRRVACHFGAMRVLLGRRRRKGGGSVTRHLDLGGQRTADGRHCLADQAQQAQGEDRDATPDDGHCDET